MNIIKILITVALFWSVCLIVLPDKTSEKWMNILFVSFILLSVFSQVGLNSFDVTCGFTAELHSLINESSDISSSVLSFADEESEVILNQRVSEYIYHTYGYKVNVNCTVKEGKPVSVTFDGLIDEDIIEEINNLFMQ